MARRDDDDDLPWLAEGVREEASTLVPRARLFGGALIAILLAALVALGVYFASGHKSDGSGGYARPEDAPLIAADAGPYKVAPLDPGGARITGIDDTIAATAEGRDPGSALLPETTEEPLARPVAGAPAPTDLLAPAPVPARIVPPVERPAPAPRPIAPAPVVAPVTAKPGPVAAPSSDKSAGPPLPAKAAVAAPAKPVAAPPAKADGDRPEKSARPDPVKPAKPGKDAAKASDPLATPPDAAARAATFDPDTPKSAKATRGVTLQLGAFSTRDKADAAWAKAGGDGALSGLTKRIEPVERDGATLYRLRASGVASADAAGALCARLKAAGAACIVAE